MCKKNTHENFELLLTFLISVQMEKSNLSKLLIEFRIASIKKVIFWENSRKTIFSTKCGINKFGIFYSTSHENSFQYSSLGRRMNE